MDQPIRKKRVLTPEQAYVKIRHYCAYQERTHQEVKFKLVGYGVKWSEASKLIAKLIEEGFLNEERFARAFAGGKFRSKDWGRKKIEIELRKKQISTYCIQKALKEEIGIEDYEKKLIKLAQKKWKLLGAKEISGYEKQAKTRQFLLMKGFENEIITQTLKKIADGEA
ncbi:MAG: hypothetical protein RLZZ595_1683 [Bacteroidota bacterium]|jgi:regulatory protein